MSLWKIGFARAQRPTGRSPSADLSCTHHYNNKCTKDNYRATENYKIVWSKDPAQDSKGQRSRHEPSRLGIDLEMPLEKDDNS